MDVFGCIRFQLANQCCRKTGFRCFEKYVYVIVRAADQHLFAIVVAQETSQIGVSLFPDLIIQIKKSENDLTTVRCSDPRRSDCSGSRDGTAWAW